MGYRSDVTIAIYGDTEPFATFKDEATQRFKAIYSDDEIYLRESEFKTCFSWDPNFFLFEVEGWKWYEEYPAVQFYEGLLDLAAELGLNAEFIRVGDEFEDVETKYRGDDIEYRLGVERRIVINDHN